jgi:hypothetical protein
VKKELCRKVFFKTPKFKKKSHWDTLSRPTERGEAEREKRGREGGRERKTHREKVKVMVR